MSTETSLLVAAKNGNHNEGKAMNTTTSTEPESPCDLRCGYVSSGRDLIDHMLYEHKRCPDCGSAPIAVYDSVTHEPWCPRLQPGYVYPSLGAENLEVGRCACWETCQNDAEPDSDMCADCLAEGCPGGKGCDDGCE